MFSEVTRREFLKSSAAVTVTAPTVASWVGAAYANDVAVQATLGAHRVDADLLHAVGERIGSDAALRVAPNGESVSLMYFDYAGSSIDPLRTGIERGLSLHCGDRVAANEISLPYGELLGVAIVRNLETAVETRVEIDATMLSHLALIEDAAPSISIAKTSITSADAAYFYNVPAFA
jgi:hypothetical protein